MENCTRPCSGLSQLCCVPSCVGREAAQHLPINHVSRSHREHSSWLSPGSSPWEPSILASGWQALGDAGRTSCEPLGQHCHVIVPCGVQSLLRGRGQHPDRTVPGSLPSQRGLGLQRLHKSCWSWAVGISSSLFPSRLTPLTSTLSFSFNPVNFGAFSQSWGPARHIFLYGMPLIPHPSWCCLRSQQNLAVLSQAPGSLSAFSQQRAHAGAYCPLVPWGKLLVLFLLSSPALLVMSLLAHFLSLLKILFLGVFPLFSTQLKTQLEQNETLAEKEQMLRQKLARELEEVGVGEEDTRVCKAFLDSWLLMKPKN